MSYTIETSPRARRQLNRLPRDIKSRVTPHIDALAEEPRPSGVLKLSGYENRWRIRVGEYRIVYEIHDDRLFILLVTVGHRSQVYDR